MEVDGNMDTGASSVFNLYQEGVASDQVLQLCFLRRSAPRRLQLERTRIEDEFVLPRPELKIASMLPPVDIPLEQLVATASPPLVQKSDNAVAAASPTDAAIIESARNFFLQFRQADVEDVTRWSALTDSDWLQIHRSLQKPKSQQGQDDEMTGLDVQVPDIADVCWMLEQCRSDGFVCFVWDHLLIALLHQCVGSDTLAHERLLTLLVSHHFFTSLSPKDFRAKVRSRNLRQINDAVGAQVELALIALYRRQRNKFP